MLNELQVEQLKLRYEKYCASHSIDSDLYDINSKIDRNIEFFENWNTIETELDILAENGTLLKNQVKNHKAEQEKEFHNKRCSQEFDLLKLFDKPKIMAVCSDVNEGKSMTLYYLIKFLKQNFRFNLFSYGLRVDVGEQKIHSVEELEKISNSIVIMDEFFTLLDLEDRKQRRHIENTLRLIHHNNNILILAGVPENFKKFISAKLSVVFFKRITLGDFINGSRIKNICLNYSGIEMGASMLNLKVNEALVYNGEHYNKLNIPYLRNRDTKLKNVGICVPKNVHKRCKK